MRTLIQKFCTPAEPGKYDQELLYEMVNKLFQQRHNLDPDFINNCLIDVCSWIYANGLGVEVFSLFEQELL